MLPDCAVRPWECPGAAVGALAGRAVKNGVEAMADALRAGAEWFITTTVGWWLNIPSIDLNATAAPTMRTALLYVTLAVAAGGMMWAGLRMAFRRNAEPAWDIGTTLLRLAAVSALGIVAPQLLLRAGDAFSTGILDAATSGQVGERLGNIALMAGVRAPGAVILAALVMMLAGVAQVLAMFLREGGIVILSGVLVLSAAGGFNPATKTWFPRVVGWLTALILYKPVAALVYAFALAQVGSADDPRNLFIGIAMLLLSIIALPTMMKFFAFMAPGAISAAGGHGGGAAIAGGLMTAAAMRGSGHRTFSDQAEAINRSLGRGGASERPTGASPTSAATSISAGGTRTAAASSSAVAGSAGAGAGAAGGATGGAAAGAAAAGPAGIVLAAGATAARQAAAAGGKAMSGGALGGEEGNKQ